MMPKWATKKDTTSLCQFYGRRIGKLTVSFLCCPLNVASWWHPTVCVWKPSTTKFHSVLLDCHRSDDGFPVLALRQLGCIKTSLGQLESAPSCHPISKKNVHSYKPFSRLLKSNEEPSPEGGFMASKFDKNNTADQSSISLWAKHQFRPLVSLCRTNPARFGLGDP